MECVMKVTGGGRIRGIFNGIDNSERDETERPIEQESVEKRIVQIERGVRREGKKVNRDCESKR